MTNVRFTHVTKAYGPLRAIDDVSISVKSGEFTTVLGPSGSGKTTMLSLIAGITRPTSGRIDLGDREITFVPAAERNIGLVFQSYALFPHMSIFDNVAFPLRVRGMGAAELSRRVGEALRLVRLEGLRQRKPHQLSGGQQQRVALARAIVFEPAILLLDEPLAALDRKLREEVRLEIRELQRKLGITTIMVTHDQEEALSLSDQVVLLSKGRVEQVGAPDEIYHRPSTRFAADFLGMANFIEGSYHEGHIVSPDGERFPCAPTNIAHGARVCGLLRPEDIRAGGEGGHLAGIVRDVVFLGETVRYLIELKSGRRLTANVAGARGRHVAGAGVSLSWDPKRVWILPDNSDRIPADGNAAVTERRTEKVSVVGR
ncbi:ABC transporter ATP-binding protein [Kumtagia ephedrae]|uniref:Polyamine ABC transporter ATP-binding protein n=1 Tax=Kumtagia ephedrae TaxID=2116701 RepID=A0A2P7RVF8_9HYPH|nr:ABC transporter ATP-binding protein [Mesorhizobium ephedrae]PSJ54208.1 polyamine ABC transporter ATP-binding protein [Mesorhizobium ephedrae]